MKSGHCLISVTSLWISKLATLYPNFLPYIFHGHVCRRTGTTASFSLKSLTCIRFSGWVSLQTEAQGRQQNCAASAALTAKRQDRTFSVRPSSEKRPLSSYGESDVSMLLLVWTWKTESFSQAALGVLTGPLYPAPQRWIFPD